MIIVRIIQALISIAFVAALIYGVMWLLGWMGIDSVEYEPVMIAVFILLAIIFGTVGWLFNVRDFE